MVATKSSPIKVSDKTDKLTYGVGSAAPFWEWLGILIGYGLVFLLYKPIYPHLFAFDYVEYFKRLQYH